MGHIKQWFSRQRHRWLLPQRSLASQPMVAVLLVTQPVRPDGASPKASPTLAANTCKLRQRSRMTLLHTCNHHVCAPFTLLRPYTPVHQRVDRARSAQTEHDPCRRSTIHADTCEDYHCICSRQLPYTCCRASTEYVRQLC